MSELICEAIAHRAGFAVPVGNWISPNGSLILGSDGEHHRDTIRNYWGINSRFCENCENVLQCMNLTILQGFIRLCFREDVSFQVGAEKIDDLWSSAPNYSRMMGIISRLEDVEMHIFSKNFYVIGQGNCIIRRGIGDLQIREK